MHFHLTYLVILTLHNSHPCESKEEWSFIHYMFICARIYIFFREYLFYLDLDISTKLFLSSISISLRKIEKYLDMPLKTHKFKTKYGILLSSSKGNYVKPHSDI